MVFDREKKLNVLKKYSDIDKVKEQIEQFLLPYMKDPIEFDVSTRKDKKYMIRGKFTNNKFIHFGQMGYEDYTKHGSTKRRMAFKERNNKWINKPVYSPAFLSYILLW